MSRTYSELLTFPTFEERFEYLKLSGKVGDATFGYDRYLYQDFLRSDEWKSIRDYVIIRDNACDLAIPDRAILGNTKILIHHLNPITKDDVLRRSKFLTDPEYMVCTLKNTHDAIHYGDSNLLYKDPIVRKQFDTCPWKIFEKEKEK